LKLHVRELKLKLMPNRPLSRNLRNRIRHSWKPKLKMKPLREPLLSNKRRRKLFPRLPSRRGSRLLPMPELTLNRLPGSRQRPSLMSMRKPARRLSSSLRKRWNLRQRSRLRLSILRKLRNKRKLIWRRNCRMRLMIRKK